MAATYAAPQAANAPEYAPRSLAAAFLVGVALAVAVPVPFPHVVQTDGLSVLKPPVTDTLLTAGPGPRSVIPGNWLVPTLVGALVAVASNVFVAVIWASSVQSPVAEGTASAPEPIASRFVPQLAACARCRFLLSWS
jgi:hypothetical protein